MSRSRRARCARSCRRPPPEEGEPFARVLADLDPVLMPGITHWNHPRFFAYFGISGLAAGHPRRAPGRGAQRQRRCSGAPRRPSTELEEVALAWLAELLGLPAGWHGHIEDTASTSTLAALARRARGDPRAPHRRLLRARPLLGRQGLPAARARAAPRPGRRGLPPAADALDLSDACAVVATVGTTSTTSVDPVPAIADACAARGRLAARRRRLRAARPASAPSCAGRFAGFERADSLVVNPHKWLFTPLDCSASSRARPDDLRAAFSLVPEYLRTPPTTACTTSTSTARRWAGASARSSCGRCCAATGARGCRRMIREHVRLAELFEGWVRDEPGWELCAPRPFSVVCFRPDGRRTRDNEALLAAVNADGAASTSRTRGSTAATCCAWRSATGTNEDDVRRDLERPQTRGRTPRRRRRRKGDRLMRVLVLQHIACEPPGVFEDVLLERGARAPARRARRGRPAARLARLRRDRRDGRTDERQRRGQAALAHRREAR